MRTGPNRGLSAGQEKVRPEEKVKGEANITFYTLHSTQPAYLHSALHVCHSTCSSVRLSNTSLLSVPFVRTSFGACSFSVAVPTIWNSHLQLSERVRALTHSAITSRPTISSRPSNRRTASSIEPQIRLLLTNRRVYKLHFLTHLFALYTQDTGRYDLCLPHE